MERSAPTPLEPNSVEGPKVSVVGNPVDTGDPAANLQCNIHGSRPTPEAT